MAGADAEFVEDQRPEEGPAESSAEEGPEEAGQRIKAVQDMCAAGHRVASVEVTGVDSAGIIGRRNMIQFSMFAFLSAMKIYMQVGCFCYLG